MAQVVASGPQDYVARIGQITGVIYSQKFPKKASNRARRRCANGSSSAKWPPSKLELVPKLLRLDLNGNAVEADFEAKNRVICFTYPNPPPSEIIIAIVGTINQDYP